MALSSIQHRPSATSSFPGLFHRSTYMLALRKQQDIDCDVEFLCTVVWDNGRTYNWQAVSLYLDYLPANVRVLDQENRNIWISRVMNRMEHHCMKCKVNCNIKKHVCRDCLLCSFIGSPLKKCDCYAKCEFSVLPVHAGMSV